MRLAGIVVIVLVGCGSVTARSPADGGAGAGGEALMGGGSGGGTGAVAGSAGSPEGTGGTGGAVIIATGGQGGGAGKPAGKGGSGGTSSSTGGAGATTTALTVQLAERDLAATDPSVGPHFKIFNGGTTTIDLSTITLRYWYTEEQSDGVTLATTPIAQSAACDNAAINCANVTTSFVQVSPPRTGANFYFQLGFTSGAGTLAPGANTNEIQTRFNKTDFSYYNELDDYSYLATLSYTATTKVTAYQNGALIYGVEPTQ